MAKYSATNDNLIEYALEPAMRWLIGAALNGSTLTYGEVKRRLEAEAGFSTIFATRIGLVAGVLMETIQEEEPSAPLINVLVVNQTDGLPSRGAGSFMAKRFRNSQLAAPSYKKRFPAMWKANFDRAASEVYRYSPEQWADLYQRVFNKDLNAQTIDLERRRLQDGNENDYGTGSNKYGAGGEGDYHRALRLWVTANPGEISKSYASARTETEFSLDSGDRVDSVYHLADRTVVLEVKSRISNAIDLRRGVFQCIKYRAVKQAMDVRQDARVDAVLVTETEVPGELAALLKRHGIQHRMIDLKRHLRP